jgi:ATP-dependent DNA helicase RecG
VLWEKINARNDIYQVQEEMVRRDIRTFSEEVVREAILNAVTHRDYSDRTRSVFIMQNPESITFESPGGFPEPVTTENILHERAWRNRRIAETFEKCGFVERSGQGIDLMYERCIREAKALPDFSHSDTYTVRLTLNGVVQDAEFLRFLNKVRQEQKPLELDDLRVLDAIRRDEQTIAQQLRNRIDGLRQRGLVEVTGRGRGTKYLLSEEYYEFIGQPGTYTRKLGLDREQRKQLLLNHIERHRDEGSPLRDLLDVLPGTSRSTVQRMLTELEQEQQTHNRGETKASRWYPGPAPD